MRTGLAILALAVGAVLYLSVPGAGAIGLALLAAGAFSLAFTAVLGGWARVHRSRQASEQPHTPED